MKKKQRLLANRIKGGQFYFKICMPNDLLENHCFEKRLLSIQISPPFLTPPQSVWHLGTGIPSSSKKERYNRKKARNNIERKSFLTHTKKEEQETTTKVLADGIVFVFVFMLYFRRRQPCSSIRRRARSFTIVLPLSHHTDEERRWAR